MKVVAEVLNSSGSYVPLDMDRVSKEVRIVNNKLYIGYKWKRPRFIKGDKEYTSIFGFRRVKVVEKTIKLVDKEYSWVPEEDIRFVDIPNVNDDMTFSSLTPRARRIVEHLRG